LGHSVLETTGTWRPVLWQNGTSARIFNSGSVRLPEPGESMKRWMLALLALCLAVGPSLAQDDENPGAEGERAEEGMKPGKGSRGKGERAEKRKAPKEVQEFREGMRAKQQEFQNAMKEKREGLAKKLEGLEGEKCRELRKTEMQALKKEREAHRAAMDAERDAFVKANPEAGRFFEKGRKGKDGKAAKGKKGERMKKRAKKGGMKLRCKGDKPPKKGAKGRKNKVEDEADADEDGEAED